MRSAMTGTSNLPPSPNRSTVRPSATKIQDLGRSAAGERCRRHAQDLSFIAITGTASSVGAAGSVTGYNVTVGGGMGMSHGEPETYPRTADLLGFCTPEQAVDVAEKVVTVQRDFGNRSNRKHARLKYTVEDMGLEGFRAEVEKRLGYHCSHRATSVSTTPAIAMAG